MKILIFGGTFNPVHIGHVAMCKAAQNAIKPDKTLIIPTFLPPHKCVNGVLADGDDRINMCKLAFEDFRNTEISDIELSAEEKSYSVITLRKLHEIYPDAELFVLCGADMFLTLKSWYKYDELISLATFCAVPRDEGVDELKAYAKTVEEDGGKCVVIDSQVIDVSSTDIRSIIAQNGDFCTLLPEKVAEYIKKNKLFR